MLHHGRGSIKVNYCRKFQKKTHTKTSYLCLTVLHRYLIANKSTIHDGCHRCGKIGHFARDCNEQRNNNTYKKYSGYPSISSGKKYGKIDAQIAESTAKSYTSYYDSKSTKPDGYENKLIKSIQSNEYNSTIKIFHIMMQQHIKLNNKSIFCSILQAFKLSSNKQQFHILELVDFMKYNDIELDANRFAEILGICVHKNDEYSAKQIALLWFESMPNFPILPLIHCLSSQTNKTKQHKGHKIWQSIINELTNLSASNNITDIIDTDIRTDSTNNKPISATDYITQQLAQIQVNLTAQNHQLAIQHLHELHSFNHDNIMHHNEDTLYIYQWLLRQELMNGDVHTIESNDTLQKLYDLGFRDIQQLYDYMSDDIYALERRLAFMIKFIAYNTDIGIIKADIINHHKWINNMISIIIDTVLKTNTTHLPHDIIESLFAFINTHYKSNNLLFHKHLFEYLKTKIISYHQSIKQQNKNKDYYIRGKSIQNNSSYVPLRKLFEFINGFNLKHIEQISKINEFRYDILPLMQQCPIQLFYAKANYFAHMLSSKDLTNAIVEAAFRFDAKQLGYLLYYLFYSKTPAIINSDAFDFIQTQTPTIYPLQIDWRDLQKIYSTVLGLSNKSVNQLKDIDIMHLLHYTPLPVIADKTNNENDKIHLIRKRQQRVLQILTGINARYGSFDNVMKGIYYFEHDSVISEAMKSYGTFYLNETLIHCFTNTAVQFKAAKLAELEYVSCIKEMTQKIYKQWRECVADMLDAEGPDNRCRYAKYLCCLENLSTQIRLRQIVPLAQYLLYVLDECNIAPTWNIYQNIWFAFNVSDKYMPYQEHNENVVRFIESDAMEDVGDEARYEAHEFGPVKFEFDALPFEYDALSVNDIDNKYCNILDRKYKELQGKYMTQQHIDYLLENRYYEEAILMLNKYENILVNVTDEYKLKCMKLYVIESELRNNINNYYRFAISHWFPVISNEPMNANYFVQRRIDSFNDNGIIYANDWYKKEEGENIYIDKDKDITFYIPMEVMHEIKYKTEIIRYCRDMLFNPENEKYNHLQLEIVPYPHSHSHSQSVHINKNKLELNSMKYDYDLFIIRGCNTLEEKLSIWSEIIDLFEHNLNLLSTVSCDHFPNYNKQLSNVIHKISQKYQCKIDSNSISSFKFDNIPTFFIWKSMFSEFEHNNLQSASEELNKYLIENNNYFKQKAPMLNIEISSKYTAALNKMFYSDSKQINKDLKYIRDSTHFSKIDMNIMEKDKYDLSKGGVIKISAPTQNLRKRIYQQIFYTHPPANDINFKINSNNNEDTFEWKDMDKMLFNLISSMQNENTLAISNAIYFSRVNVQNHKTNNYKEFMLNLFDKNKSNIAINDNDEIIKLCQLLFSRLSMGQNEFNRTAIAQIFYNIVTNNYNDIICELLYCTILSLCNHSMHFRSLSITDFHRIRAAFLNYYCGKCVNDENGINENLSLCLQQLSNHESYLLILLEYLYISCLMNHPNLSGHIIRFLNELLTLMVHETKLETETFSQFCSSAFDLLLIDIQTPQQNVANAFMSLYKNEKNGIEIGPKHAIYSEMDVESLKIILSELNPLEMEHITKHSIASMESIEILYKNIFYGCSLCGNIECIKLLLNRVEFLAKAYQTNENEVDGLYTFGIDDKFLHTIYQNVWIYYNDVIKYDVEICVHVIMQLLECMLSGDNKLWKHVISQDTITTYVIFMAENNLISEMFELKQLIMQSTHQEKFKQLINVLSDVDYEIYLQQDSASQLYQRIKSVE